MGSPVLSRREDGNTLLQVGLGPHGATRTVIANGDRQRSNRCKINKNKFMLGASVIVSVLLVALLLQYSTQSCHNRAPVDVCLSEECIRTAASLMEAMDRSVDPCDDFFQYACGAWNKIHPIPEDKSSTSTFEVLADQLQVTLKTVLEEQITNTDSNATIKAKTFYNSCMNTSYIRSQGDVELKRVLEGLGGWPVVDGDNWRAPKYTVETLIGLLRHDFNEGILVEMWVGPDDKNSSINIIQIDQMTLALPSRDYYIKEDTSVDLAAYHTYMVKIAVLLGADVERADREMMEVIELEKQLANITMAEADRHDTSSIYDRRTLASLKAHLPGFNWSEYLNTALGQHLSMNEPIVSYAMSYFKGMEDILLSTDNRIVNNYVMWRVVNTIVPLLLDEYNAVSVEFRKILQGVQSDRSRWTLCVELTNKKFSMAVAALFIKDNFNPESKEVALTMIHTIRESFNELLDHNEWMDKETIEVARMKANAMNERIGYPDMLTNPEELDAEYENLTIISNDFMGNVFRVLENEALKNLEILRQKVNKDKWTTEPAVVNAFYNPNRNDIVFPAGILQPLFYSKHFPKSLNYGGIGVVIGHEITHGFDDKGRQFDKDGNMMQWWNNVTINAFRERAQCIIDQYSSYEIKEVGLKVNGKMTQGENIADNGGLKQSFRAYKKWVREHGVEPDLPGLNLTHDQLFFLNYAQIWCGSMRPEDALNKIRSSVHPPGPIRVLGPLSNSIDFARAYNCSLGSRMNPINKCNVW